MSVALDYFGPQCPRCGVTLAESSLRTALLTCERCRGKFEATVFQPPQRRQQITEVVGAAGPEGANACANHARNAAVASCVRCGLFICSLCDMNVGAGSYCPPCFDRVRNEGTLKPVATKYKDYASMARVTAIAGIIFWFIWPVIGGMAMYYAVKGMKQRREQGRSTFGMIVVFIFGILYIAGGLAIYGFMIWGMFESAKS